MQASLTQIPIFGLVIIIIIRIIIRAVIVRRRVHRPCMRCTRAYVRDVVLDRPVVLVALEHDDVAFRVAHAAQQHGQQVRQRSLKLDAALRRLGQGQPELAGLQGHLLMG